MGGDVVVEDAGAGTRFNSRAIRKSGSYQIINLDQSD